MVLPICIGIFEALHFIKI